MSQHTGQTGTTRTTALFGMRQPHLAAALGCLLAALLFVAGAAAQDDQPGYVSPRNSANNYLDAIDRIEADYGPYATELSDLYLGLGQTLLTNGEFEKAKDAFHRGVMVLRVNSGPNSPEQTNHLYLIANVETLLGETRAADDILHNIYFINAQHYGATSPEMLPVLDRMYTWYQLTRPPASDLADYADYERIVELTEKMVGVCEVSKGLGHPDTTAAYRRLGEAHFQAVRYLMGQGMAMTLDAYVAVSSRTLESASAVKVSVGKHYDAGRKAYKTYLESLAANGSTTPPEFAEALADMGDWYLVLEKSRRARGLYQEAYQVLAQSEEYAELAASHMNQPRPVHFAYPQPSLPEDAPVELLELNLDISMTVTSFGDVRYVEVLNAPEDISEDDLGAIIRGVRETPFRPAMKEGQVVTTKDFIWQYAIVPQESPS